MPPDLAALKAGLADRYALERELGRGGMATVYLAEDLKHHRKVALKVLSPDVASAIGADRFLREIEIVARLRHPHILPLYDSGEAAGFLFYVMPFVEGESLRDRLSRDKQLSVDDALQFAREISDALSYAHSHGVVHRDIKPENILIDSGHAVVADFGISKAIAAAGGDQLTETGLSLGTPTYMSPEQASGESEIDGRSDLYALGCVLYEMLAGRPPFSGPTMESVVRQHLTLEPTPITALRPAVPGWVAAAISRSLAKAPADRFNPVAQFGEALRAPAFNSTQVPASTPGAPSAPGAGRTRRFALIGVAAVVVIAAGLWGVSAFRSRGPVIDSLAVLPLQNLSGDSAQGYFVDGMHDALIGELAKISGLRVASRTSAMSYRTNPKPIPVVARELGVSAVVEGTVFRSGDSVRIQVQLIGVDPERHLWAESYQRDVRNAVSVMGDVAKTIAQAVRVTLTPQELGGLATTRAVNPVAQDHLLRGRQLLYRRDREGIVGSIGEFRAALRVDPDYAAALAALSSAYSLAGIYAFAPNDSGYDWAARSLAAANRAIALDSMNAEAWAARGVLGMTSGARPDDVERDLRRAILLKPSYAEAYSWLAQLIVAYERLPEAITLADKALVLDPVSPAMRIGKGNMAWNGDSAELVVEVVRPLRILRPDMEIAWGLEGMALAVLGRGAECAEFKLAPASIRAMCLHAAGRVAGAERLAREAESRAGGGVEDLSAVYLPGYLAWSGRLDNALRSFERQTARSPFSMMVSTSHRLYRPVAKLEGGRFFRELIRMRTRAWNRVVEESRKVALP